jgi:ribonuclease VapC
VIAVDTSALMAIVLDEPTAQACMAALEAEDEILISAGTLAELLIVSARRRVGTDGRLPAPV